MVTMAFMEMPYLERFWSWAERSNCSRLFLQNKSLCVTHGYSQNQGTQELDQIIGIVVQEAQYLLTKSLEHKPLSAISKLKSCFGNKETLRRAISGDTLNTPSPFKTLRKA